MRSSGSIPREVRPVRSHARFVRFDPARGDVRDARVKVVDEGDVDRSARALGALPLSREAVA